MEVSPILFVFFDFRQQTIACDGIVADLDFNFVFWNILEWLLKYQDLLDLVEGKIEMHLLLESYIFQLKKGSNDVAWEINGVETWFLFSPISLYVGQEVVGKIEVAEGGEVGCEEGIGELVVSQI